MEKQTTMSGQKIGFFSQKSQEKIKKIKSGILKAIIWTLIGSIIIGAFGILFIGASGFEAVGKFIGTLYILALAALVSVVDFHAIESGRKSAQVLAILGIVMNIIWAILWSLATWGAFDIWEDCSVRHCMFRGFSGMGIITMAATYLSTLGIFGSYTMSLYEGTKVSVIKPLKITAVACLAYEEIYAVIKLFASTSTYHFDDSRFGMLATFTGGIWFIVMILAVILSKRETNAYKKKQQQVAAPVKEEKADEKPTSTAPKTDEELRAEIEEKVRREIIEKEVREKVEKEMAEKKASEE